MVFEVNFKTLQDTVFFIRTCISGTCDGIKPQEFQTRTYNVYIILIPSLELQLAYMHRICRRTFYGKKQDLCKNVF